MPKKTKKAHPPTKPGIGQLYVKDHYTDIPDGGPLKIGHVLQIFFEKDRSIPKTICAVTEKLQQTRTEPGVFENIEIRPYQMIAVTVNVLGRCRHLTRENEMAGFVDVCCQEFTNFRITPEQSTQAVQDMDVDPSTTRDSSPQRSPSAPSLATDEPVPGPSTPQQPIPSQGPSTRKSLKLEQTPQKRLLKRRLTFVAKTKSVMKKKYMNTVKQLRLKLAAQSPTKLKYIRQTIKRKNLAVEVRDAKITELKQALRKNFTQNEVQHMKEQLSACQRTQKRLKKAHKKILEELTALHANYVPLDEHATLQHALEEKDATICALENDKLKLEETLARIQQEVTDNASDND